VKHRIPLVGQPNQRNFDSLQALIEGKDQRYQNGLIIPVYNSLSNSVKHYFEKRPGLEQTCLAAFGDIGSNVFYSRSTGKLLTFFEDADGIVTPYVDCVDVGPFDLDETPIDRGDGRFLAITDSAIGGVAGKYLMWSANNGQIWNTTTLGGGLGITGIEWQDLDYGGAGSSADRVFIGISGSAAATVDYGFRTADGETVEDISANLPDTSGLGFTTRWARCRYIPELDRWLITHFTAGIAGYSDDNGDSFSAVRIDSGANPSGQMSVDYHPDTDTYVFACTNPFGSALRYKSGALGVASIATLVGGGAITNITLRDIRCDRRTGLVIAGGNGFWYYSEDGGRTYTLVTQDTSGSSLNIFRITPTPTGWFAVSNGVGVTSGRDFYRSTNGTSITRIDLNPTSSGIYQRVNYNGAVVGGAGYANDVIYKNFIVANDLPDDPNDFTEYEDVVPSPNVTGLSSRWAWWI
jgi:hypothetical protein